MLFALLETAPAVQSKCLIGGQGNAGMRPERRFKPGMDGRPTAASLVSSPPHYLRTTVFLSRQPGPPQPSFTEFHLVPNHQPQWLNSAIRMTMGMGTPSSKSKIER